jgi:hypothetical protein
MLSANVSPEIMEFETGWHYVATITIKDRTETIHDQFDGPDDMTKAELIALYLAGDLVMEARGSLIGVSIQLNQVKQE